MSEQNRGKIERNHCENQDWAVSELSPELIDAMARNEVYPPFLGAIDHSCETNDIHWLLYNPEEAEPYEKYAAQLHAGGEATQYHLVMSLWPYEIKAHSHIGTGLRMLGRMEDVLEDLMKIYSFEEDFQ